MIMAIRVGGSERAYVGVATSSIFEGLCSHNNGLYLLNRLYKRDPTLKSKITIGHLISVSNDKTPIIFNLYHNHLAHRILNEITTNELAAKYPHGLPDSQVNLLLLSGSEDGIKVIQKMMDAQPSIVKLMTGTVLSTPGFIKCCILPLLSSFDAGVSILHQVLDVHGENLVKEIGYALINNPVTPTSQMTAYKLLQKLNEGKRFLERLRYFGWIPPTTENPHGFFATQAPLESADLLMHYIASENTEMVQKMVRANPGLLLKTGRVEKNGIVYEIQPIEYCQMHGDCIRLKAIVDCLEESEQGQNIKNMVFPSHNPLKYV